MPAVLCSHCKTTRALVLRPKTRARLCSPCFQLAFETEIHETIIAHSIFQRGERVAIGASGGKDSTVLASVLHTLNKRYDYGLELVLLSIDEGIKGYRDDSLRAVEALGRGLELEWKVLGYETLYGWTMDQVVAQVGKKGNCTYCGVWRRQALDRGAGILRVKHVVTGHNADDVAETVLMNLLRGDLPRLGRATSIVTESAASPIKRSKPLKYAYEKEIVLYAHHKKLDYFSTECIYSPEAFRGSARALIKSLERVRPSAILDIVRSGEDMAKMTPSDETASSCVGADDDRESIGGCGSANGRSGGGEMAAMEQDLRKDEKAESRETEVTIKQIKVRQHNRHGASYKSSVKQAAGPKRPETQMMGKCVRCGYLTSQEVCKACTLLEGLNRNRPKVGIEVVRDDDSSALRRQLEGAVLSGS